MAADSTEQFELGQDAAEAYQRYLVPVFYAPCAERLFGLVPPRRGRVLDVACGTGVVALAVARRGGAGTHVTGVDPDEAMLAVARFLTGHVGAPGPIEWLQAPAEELPLEDRAFDLVYCQQGLQFFSDKIAGIAQMRRVLRPGGAAGVAVWRGPEHHTPFHEVAAVWDEYLQDGLGETMRVPFSGPQGSELRALFQNADFTDVHLRIAIIPVRFASPEAFLHETSLATPARPAYMAAERPTVEAMRERIRQRLTWATDDEGVTFPLQAWLLTATAA
ncbi:MULTISPECIES: methyltransferase domain-containing protein [Thermomonospora]|uniref:Ubiquinone/menaquinone biosynthesis C-methylase UbiE n=1 Tax=Thermomonospora cellulosilytica TaxID=1411118 RepID=A0A7W3MZ63_9ACTN|nr:MULTISPECIES: methyltransferase domain-containing protein [Thermomonospora]MBA9004594.1 ubiquinone/menaquinone biosynthesis C-methylase UbiE [Thermomonospora cellulosilytica]